MADPVPLPVKGTDEYRVPTENDVVLNGQIVGSDPDPQVRLTLLKQASAEGNDAN